MSACDYCGNPPPVLDADGMRLEPFTGWACIVCAAEIGPFDDDQDDDTRHANDETTTKEIS